MKKLASLIAVFLFTVSAYAKMPDLIVRTKLDHKRSDILLKRIETFMKNNELGDFTSMKFEERWVVDESILADHFDSKAQEVVNKISGFLPFDVSNTRIEIAVEGAHYKIKDLSLNLKNSGKNLKAEFRASGACATIDKLQITIKVPMGDDFYLPTYAPSLTSPMLLIGDMTEEECLSNEILTSNKKEKPIAFDVDLSTTFEEKEIALGIVKTSFEKIKDLVLNQRDKLQFLGLNKDNLHVDDVVLEYGPKEITFFGDKVEDLILENKDSYISILLDQFVKMIESGYMDRIVEALNEVRFDKGYWIADEDYHTYLRIDRFQKASLPNQLDTFISGGFCLTPKYLAMKENCLNEDQLYYEYEPSQTLEESLAFIDKTMQKNKNASVVASASENFINKIIDLTFKAGYWDAEFNTEDIEIGPEGGFVKFNEKGTKAKFYLQLKYNAKKFHKFLIGAKKFDLLIPIICEVSMKIVVKNKIPVLKFIVESVDTSKDTLWYGDEYMSSSFHKVKRFKKLIRKKFILPEAESYIGKSALDVELPEIKGLDIEQVKLQIDGQGRVIAILD